MSSIFKAVASRLQNLTTPTPPPTPPKPPATMPSIFEEIVEGSARVLHPKGAVFYNPAQVVNRDLSVLVLRHHARIHKRPLRILEALSATGLRSIRYYNEVPNVSRIIANDMDPTAVSVIRRSVILNGLNPETQVIPNEGDASLVMSMSLSQGQAFDVVDLDPYGSAAPFIEPSIRCLSDGGLLCVTCTDLPVLCGNSPEICYGRYASTPLKSPTTHEMAVRIVFQSVQAAANRLGRAVEPVLCAKIDFYVRLFLRVRDSKSLAQKTPSTTSLVFQCVECGTQTFQPLGRSREMVVGSSTRRKRRRRDSDSDTATADISPPTTTTTTTATTTTTTTNGNNGINDKGRASTTANENVIKTNDDKSQQTKPEVCYKFSAPHVVPGVCPQCTVCGGTMTMGGPIWNGPLIGEGVADSLLSDLSSNEGGTLKASDRVAALIRLLDEEVPSVPLFMHLPSMCRTLNTSVPPAAAVRNVLVQKGYQVSLSHVDPGSLKTTAPTALVWDILRLWTRKTGSSLLKKIDADMLNGTDNTVAGGTAMGVNGHDGKRRSAGERILIKDPVLVTAGDVDFTVKKDKFVRRGAGAERQGVRFPHNPTPNWGPKPRAGKRNRPEEET